MSIRLIKTAIISTASALTLTACITGSSYTPAEKEMAETMTSSKYQPATRERRNNIETQDLFAQAAFWSKEYQINPGDLETAIKLSAAVRKMGNPVKAIEIAQTSRAMYPRDPYLAAEYIAALIAAERASEAMQPLDTALRTSPGYARLWSLKGAALDQAEQYDLARKHYARALEITPHDPNVMANVGLSFALQGDANSAENWLRRAASVPGANSSVHQNLALVLQLQGKTQEAEQYAARNLPKSNMPNLPNVNGYQGPNQAMQPQRKPPQAYAPQARAPQYTKPQTQQRFQQPQATLQSYEGNGRARSASDAARAAAQNLSGRSNSVMTAPSAEQKSVLDRIANSIGPQAAGPQPPGPQAPTMRSGHVPASTGQAAPQGYPQMYPGPQYKEPAMPQRRGAARRRG